MTIPFPRKKVSRAVAAEELAILERTYPHAVTALEYRDPFELLIAVILSAQCTDARVNLTTPALFATYPDARALANADATEVERLIKSCGFFRQKTKSIIAAAQGIAGEHGGRVPRRSRLARSAARRRPQDGERRHVGRFRRGSVRGRHARLPRLAPARPDPRDDAAWGGRRRHQAGPSGEVAPRPPLADPARPRDLQGADPALRPLPGDDLPVPADRGPLLAGEAR